MLGSNLIKDLGLQENINIRITSDGNKIVTGELEEITTDSVTYTVVKHMTVANTTIVNTSKLFEKFEGESLVIRSSKIAGPVIVKSKSLKKLILVDTCIESLTIAADSGIDNIQIVSSRPPVLLSSGKYKFNSSCTIHLQKFVSVLVFKATPPIYNDCRPNPVVAAQPALPGSRQFWTVHAKPPVVGNLIVINTDISEKKLRAAEFVGVFMCKVKKPGMCHPVSAVSGIISGTNFHQFKPCDLPGVPGTAWYSDPRKADYNRNFYWKAGTVVQSSGTLRDSVIPAACDLIGLSSEIRALLTHHLC